MATWTDTLNARVLANVSTDELRRSYNIVLQEEFSDVAEALDGVTAAFTKLKEVRNAVSKLSSSTVEHSASLQAELDSATKLRQQLKKMVKKVATDMAAGGETEVSGYSATNQKPGKELPSQDANKREKRANESVEMKSTEKKRAKKNHEMDGAQNKINSLQAPGMSLILNPMGSKLAPTEDVVDINAADNSNTNRETATSATKMNVDNHLKVMAEVNEWDELERNKWLPGILLELEKIVKQLSSSQLQTSGPNILKFVMVWAFRYEDHENHLEAFKQFANAIRSPINNLPNDSKTLGIRRLHSRLQSFLKGAAKGTGGAHSRTNEEADTNHDILLWEANFLAPKKRGPLIPPIIQAQETEMMRPIVPPDQFRDVSKGMNTLTYWTEHERSNHRLCKLFRGLAQSAKLYAGKVSNFTVKANLLGDAQRMELVLGRLASWTIKERTTQTLAFVNQLPTSPPLEAVDIAILMTDEIVRFVEPGWKPRRDHSVLECYKRLKSLVGLLNGPTQHQREAVLTRWKMDKV